MRLVLEAEESPLAKHGSTVGRLDACPSARGRAAASERELCRPSTGSTMPVQSLRHWSKAERTSARRARAHARAVAGADVRLRRRARCSRPTAHYEMYQVVSVSRTTVLQWVLARAVHPQFLVDRARLHQRPARLFGLAHASERGFRRRRETLNARTAVLMPVYNESTARTFAALQAICESVEAPGLGAHFDYFVLSDSTNPDAWIAEERAFLALRERLGPEARIYYRHRPKNHHRKAGNIADFVTRWGGALRAHARARRRQPDDRRQHRAPRRRHGGRPRRRHHPDPAAHHQPQHPVRPRAAVRGAGLRGR